MSRRFLSGVFLGICLTGLSGCDSAFFKSHFSGTEGAPKEDAAFRSDYPKFRELLRQNHFRKALAWVREWEKVQNLSDSNRHLLARDRRRIRMIGSAYYLGISRERKKAGHYQGALAALKVAQGFNPGDPEIRKEILEAQATIIVRGEMGQDYAGMVGKLLGLKARNPKERSIDPMIGWAYSKLAESEYTVGRYPLALHHARSALGYDRTSLLAQRIRDRISIIVGGLVREAEGNYRAHRFGHTRKTLERALRIDPENKRAKKDWRILSETLKMPGIVPAKEDSRPGK